MKTETAMSLVGKARVLKTPVATLRNAIQCGSTEFVTLSPLLREAVAQERRAYWNSVEEKELAELYERIG